MVKIEKTYTSGGDSLQNEWSKKGIHLNFSNKIDETYFEYIIEKTDLHEFSEDIRIFTDAINDSDETETN